MEPWTRRTALAGGFLAMGGAAGRMSAQPAPRPPLPAGNAIPARSWLDFIPAGKHAAILDGTSTDDLTVVLQRMLDDLPPGAAVFLPGRVNIEGTLVIRNSITLYGIAGRENFDNSWDNGGPGTQILFRGTAGDALRIEGAAQGNHCFNVVLRDFIVRGNRLDDAGRRNAGVTTGSGIAVRGSREETSNIRIDFDGVHVAQAAEHGISLDGHAFGGSIRNAFLHRNGRNGLRTGDRAGVGEMWLAHLRLFQNGHDGTAPNDQAGLYWQGGGLLASQLSASESGGAGVVLGGGPVQIDMLQLESNGRAVADPAERRQLVVGTPGNGVRSALIQTMMSDPGSDFRGAHIHIAGNAHNVTLGGVLSGTLGDGGRHIVRDAGSQMLDIAALGGWQVVDDRSSDTMTRATLQVTARSDRIPDGHSGDGTAMAWRPGAILRNDLSAYAPASGVFTAPIGGMYEVEAVLPLTGLRPAHTGATLEFQATSVARSYRLGNLGAMRDAAGRFTVQARARIPMAQGATLRVVCTVAGGEGSVRASGDPREGFLTIQLG